MSVSETSSISPTKQSGVISKAPSPFNEVGVQWAWDSTSLGTFKDCPRKYFYTLVMGYRARGESVHLKFGIHYHAGLETYDRLRAEGQDHEDALANVVGKLLIDTWDFTADETAPEGRPWVSDHNSKTRENLIRSVVWYLEQFADDPAKTLILANGKPAVELTFRFQVDDNLVLSGHLDRVVEFIDGVYVMDRKTTTTTISPYYFEQYDPSNQMTLYALAARVVYQTPVRGVIIDAAQVAVGFTRFARGLTYRTPDQLEEWLGFTKSWVAQAHAMAHQMSHETDERPWVMNDKSCHDYGGCPFRRVCSRSPGVRQNILNTDFVVDHWNPLEAR